jgi:caa(3)-type oxidase subunit IV
MTNSDSCEDRLYLGVYLALLALTAVTVASALAGVGPLLAVTFAVGVAAMKASLIGWYFMHLSHERALIYGVAAAGVIAVVILAVGILPDIALKL